MTNSLPASLQCCCATAGMFLVGGNRALPVPDSLHHADMRLFGGAQFYRAMNEFRLVVGQVRAGAGGGAGEGRGRSGVQTGGGAGGGQKGERQVRGEGAYPTSPPRIQVHCHHLTHACPPFPSPPTQIHCP